MKFQIPNNKFQINLKFQISKYHFELLLFIAYLLLAVIITYPLILRFSSSVYSTPDRLIDGLANIYDLWWYKQTFLHGGSPDFIPNLGLSGVQLQRYLPYHMVITYTVAKWLTILFNEVFAFNLLILLSFPLAGIAMYLLAYYVTRNRWAAALAGFIFAFAPLHRRYAFEWLGMAQWHWLPLYVLSLLKLDKTKSIKWGLLTGLFFSITLIEPYYLGYFTIFFTLFFVFFRFIQAYVTEKKFYLDHARLTSYLLAFVTVAVLTLPVTSTFVKQSSRLAVGEEAEIPGFIHEEWPRFAFSARPWFYLLPDVNHPIFGSTVKKIYAWIARHPPEFITKPFEPREHSLYLGWTTILLSAFAIIMARRPKEVQSSKFKVQNYVWLFLFLGVAMAIFSAPPYVTINLHKIYFPSGFLYKLFPMFRSYARCGVLVLLCVSVLAAFGVKELLSVAARLCRARKRQHKVLQLLLLFIFFVLIFFEFLDFPRLRNENIAIDPAHQWLAAQPGDFAVAEWLVFNNRPLLQQRYYGKRLINPLRWAPDEVEAAMKKVDTPETIAKLRSWGVKYLVLHTQIPDYLAGIPGYKLVASFPESVFHILEVTGE